MPISKHFLKSFEQFITNYKVSGASASFISWGKEQNHSTICSYFGELLNLVISNQEVFHDASIIECLAVPINLSANTNHYLHECWNKFLIEYNSVAKVYSPIHTIDCSTPTHLQIALDGNSSERMMRDLKSALELTQKAQEFSRKAYLSEVELLKKQLEELTRTNAQLSTENRFLKEQVHNDQIFHSLQPQIATAQHQLASFADLLTTLYDITGGSISLPSKTSPTTVAILEKEKRGIVIPSAPTSPNTDALPEKDSPLTPLVMSKPCEASVIQSTIPPIAPHIAPPKMSASLQEPKSMHSGDGFFNELNLEVAKRQANRQAASLSIAVKSQTPTQKKNMYNLHY